MRLTLRLALLLPLLAACVNPAPQPAATGVTPGVAPSSTAPPLPTPAAPLVTPAIRSPTIPPSPSPLPSPDSPLPSPSLLVRGELNDVVFSPGGRWLAAASATGLYLHDARTLAFERPLLPGKWVSSLAYAPDGKTLAAAGLGWLRILDADSGREIAAQDGLPGGWVRDLAFSADGARLALLYEYTPSTALPVWDLASREWQELSFETYGTPLSLAFSPDGAGLALGTDLGRVELFDLQSGSRQLILSDPAIDGRRVTGLAFSPDGGYLAAAQESAEGSLRVWRLAAGSRKIVEQYATGIASTRPFVAFSPDGAHLVSGMEDLAVAWQRSTRAETGRLLGYSSPPMGLAVSPAGDRLAWSTWNGVVFVHALAGDVPPLARWLPYYRALNVFFTPDGGQVGAGLYAYFPDERSTPPREMVQEWDAVTGAPGRAYAGASVAAYPPRVPGLPVERAIALADSAGRLWLAGPATQAALCLPGCACLPPGGTPAPVSPMESGEAAESCTWQLPHGLSPMRLAYSPDGSLLAAWGVAGTWSAASLWDLQAGREAAWFPGGGDLAFHPEGGWLALIVDELNADHGIAAYTFQVYSLQTALPPQRLLRVELPAHGSLALSPDGRLLATGFSSLENSNPTGQDPPGAQTNGLMVWDTAAWQQKFARPIPYGLTRLAYTPQGGLLAASDSGAIYWFDHP
jgi:WD40 repeat protein